MKYDLMIRQMKTISDEFEEVKYIFAYRPNVFRTFNDVITRIRIRGKHDILVKVSVDRFFFFSFHG